MDREAVRAFARRDWKAIEQAKRRHWAQRFREAGSAATFSAGQALRDLACRVRPDWPTSRDRAGDLAHHLDLKRDLERAAHAFLARR
jgi:hypothetical protein